MSRSVAIVLTVAAGGLVALQPPANAALSRHISDLGAALISTAISMMIFAVLLIAFGDPGRLSGITSIRPEQLIGGLGGAAVVGISLVTVRSLGAGAVIALLVAAQLVVAVVADRLGLFGLHHVGIGWARSIGVVVVIAGTWLVTQS